MKLIIIFSFTLLCAVQILGQENISPIKKYFLITSKKLSWSKALHHCRSLDMRLVSIESEEENDRIVEQILSEGYSDKMFYTSGYKFESNGTMKWMGNNKPLTYTNWAAGQPNNALGLDKCIHLHESVSNDGHLPFTWNDICCVAELNFICEKLPEYDNNVELFGQKSLAHKIYYPITLVKLSWSKALDYCQSLDMRLVSIESEEENDQLIEQIMNEGLGENLFWTSGIRLDNNATKWMGNNKLATYTNWAPDEPNNRDKTEKCIHMYDTCVGMKWNDLKCSDELYFICERDNSYENNNNFGAI